MKVKSGKAIHALLYIRISDDFFDVSFNPFAGKAYE